MTIETSGCQRSGAAQVASLPSPGAQDSQRDDRVNICAMVIGNDDAGGVTGADLIRIRRAA